MSLPGFSADVSLTGKSLAQYSRVWSGAWSKNQVIPALPIGGYGQLACVKAICKLWPSQCASAWQICEGSAAGGVECVATGNTVTCCYAGDCTTFR